MDTPRRSKRIRQQSKSVTIKNQNEEDSEFIPAGTQGQVTKEDIRKAYVMLHENMEPFFQGEWRREPWPVRPYEVIQDYVIATDLPDQLDREILKCGLKTDLQSDESVLINQDGISPPSSAVVFKDFPPRCLIDVDVKECSVWGLDCFTRRLIYDCLSLCPDLEPRAGADVKTEFIERFILPTLNSLGDNGWNLFLAMESIRSRARERQDMSIETVAEKMEQIMKCIELRKWKPELIVDSDLLAFPNVIDNFRAHPKGQGVVCCRPGGLSRGTFVEEYLGEVYTPSRWFERQDVIKKRHPDGYLPDFYNIQIERPRDDDLGYGVVFVEGASRGNFASRLCHSCSPNCQTISFCAGGRVTNAIFTLRDVDEGEELTWDYSCVTESEKEFRAAICLCGTSVCRGSFLYFAHSSAFQQVMAGTHTFLDRNALLLRACSEKMTLADFDRLQRNGIKKYVLYFDQDTDSSIPEWLMKWASLILEYIEFEKAELPKLLVETSNKHKTYNEVSALDESNGVVSHRLQNLVITLDKAKYFLRRQSGELASEIPLRFLTEREIIQFLWTSRSSVAVQALAQLKEYYNRVHEHEQVFKVYKQSAQNGTNQSDDSREMLEERFQKISNVVTSLNPETVDEARNGLLKICETLRSFDQVHSALHDVLLLKASTRFYFTSAKYESFRSSPVDLSAADLPSEDVVNRKKSKKPKCNYPDYKRYNSDFIWGQLVAWFKQTVYDPTASLTADRRGTVCLPSVENCFTQAVVDGSYVSDQRQKILKIMTARMESQWPTGLIWSYKNSERIYGTPFLDFAIEKAVGDPSKGQRLNEMLQILSSSFSADAFDVKPTQESPA